MQYLVGLGVPRSGGWREWAAVGGAFDRALAGQDSKAVTGMPIDSETRRGREYVRVVIVATVTAADASEALGLAWQAFRDAAAGDLAGWDLARASAEVSPAAP